jgi:hypothetical protein
VKAWKRIGMALTGAALIATAAGARLQAAAVPSSTFAQAHEAYRTKDYAKALELYRQVAATVDNAVVHYDLGCAAYKTDHVGEAILHFEKARRFAPRDPDVNANLEFARGRVKDAMPEEEPDLLTRLVWGPLDRLSLNELATAASIAWWLTMACVLALMVTRDAERRARWHWPLAICAALTLALAVPFALKYHAEEMTDWGIVQAREVNVLSGPGTEEVKRFVLHEGAKVRMLARWGEKWVHIALPNGENGWALAEQIGEI